MRFKMFWISMATCLCMLAGFSGNVFADSASEVCAGVPNATFSGGKCQVGGTSLNTVVSNVVNVLSVLVGIIAVIMVIVGGLKYITSGGDSGKVTSAKSTILYAIIGIVIASFSQVLVHFVLYRIK